MNGFARTFFAGAATVFRGLSHVFIFPADGLKAAATWCDERARAGGGA